MPEYSKDKEKEKEKGKKVSIDQEVPSTVCRNYIVADTDKICNLEKDAP